MFLDLGLGLRLVIIANITQEQALLFSMISE